MIDISKIDYALLDRPEILMYLFHPRPEFGRPASVSGVRDILKFTDSDIANDSGTGAAVICDI